MLHGIRSLGIAAGSVVRPRWSPALQVRASLWGRVAHSTSAEFFHALIWTAFGRKFATLLANSFNVIQLKEDLWAQFERRSYKQTFNYDPVEANLLLYAWLVFVKPTKGEEFLGPEWLWIADCSSWPAFAIKIVAKKEYVGHPLHWN